MAIPTFLIMRGEDGEERQVPVISIPPPFLDPNDSIVDSWEMPQTGDTTVAIPFDDKFSEKVTALVNQSCAETLCQLLLGKEEKVVPRPADVSKGVGGSPFDRVRKDEALATYGTFTPGGATTGYDTFAAEDPAKLLEEIRKLKDLTKWLQGTANDYDDVVCTSSVYAKLDKEIRKRVPSYPRDLDLDPYRVIGISTHFAETEGEARNIARDLQGNGKRVLLVLE